MRPQAEQGWKSQGIPSPSDPLGWVLCMLGVHQSLVGVPRTLLRLLRWWRERPGLRKFPCLLFEGDSCAEITPAIRYPAPAITPGERQGSASCPQERVTEKGPLRPVQGVRGVPQPAPNRGSARRGLSSSSAGAGFDPTPKPTRHETKHLLSKAADRGPRGPLGMCHPAPEPAPSSGSVTQ